jgi:integrative and conjugative element protein (TIGR02256 family)
MKFDHLGFTYVFTSSCLETLASHRQRSCLSRENGGQLFARITKRKISVEAASVTRGRSKRTRFGFWPDRKAEQEDIVSLFRSGLHYVGDWHTHPEPVPSPSPSDIEKIVDIFKSSNHELSTMLMVIVGQADFPQGLFVGAANKSKVVQLHLPQAASP